MLRRLAQELDRRLLSPTLLPRSSTSQGLSSIPACVSGCRRLSAEPLTDDDYETAGSCVVNLLRRITCQCFCSNAVSGVTGIHWGTVCYHRDMAAARQRKVHEQLVYELFGIREQVREQIKSRRFGPPRRIRREDEPDLYSVPLK